MKGKILLTLLATLLAQGAMAQSKNKVAIQGNLEFSEKCTSGPEVTVSAVGDVLLHGVLQAQAFRDPQTYKSLWPAMIPIFGKFDVSYANFEGPAAEGLTSGGQKTATGFKYDPKIYSSFPMFNYHPHLVRDLKQSGLDVVSTANNHSLDRRQLGADMTLEAMREYGLRYTGTKPRDAQNHGWHAITETNGFRIAWLACTFSTNGLPDSQNQVLFCYQNRAEVLAYVRALAKDPNISAIIVTPHWGNEYQHSPAGQEVEFGRQLIDAGALAVLATHPHVIQPWEKYVSSASGKEGMIAFSSGNFVSGQFHRVPTQVGMMYGIKLVQDPQSRHLKIKTARYLPLLMKSSPYRVEPVTNDSSVASQFSSLWTKMYHPANRISNLDEIFPNECQ